MKDYGIAPKQILISILIGSVAYQIILAILLQFSISAELWFGNNLVAFIFTTVGFYYSFKEKKGWPINLSISIFLTTALHMIFHKYLLSLSCGPIKHDLINILPTMLLSGYLGGFTKKQMLDNKSLPAKTLQENYDIALDYKMNPYIRPLGVIVGFLFLFSPFLVAYDLFFNKKINNDGEAWMYLFIVTMSLLAMAMGAMFLAFSIPGKTPTFLLKRMENKIKK